jgi:ABC-type polar amino acid transport system ATPase subunit
MITVSELVKSHEDLRVLDGVSLSVAKREVAVLIGPSGGGKSTLLRCINGLEPFQQGAIQVEDLQLLPSAGRDTNGEMLRRLRLRVGMVFQQFHLFPHLKVLDNVTAGPRWGLGRPRAEAEAEAERLLARVGLADKKDRRPDQLSGGQQQRVAIARALAVKPAALLFDEPTSALDPRNAAEVLEVITELAVSGLTMIVVTHAMQFARSVAHSVYVMEGGRILESGPADQVFEQPQQEVTRTFLLQHRFV